MGWPKGRLRGPRSVPIGAEASGMADDMSEDESAELDAMVEDTQQVAGDPEVQSNAAAQQMAAAPSASPATACEFCGADPKIPSKGFDCGCHRRQTVEGKLASARYKEVANKK